MVLEETLLPCPSIQKLRNPLDISEFRWLLFLFSFFVNDNLLCNLAMLQAALLPRGIREAYIVYLSLWTWGLQIPLPNNGIGIPISIFLHPLATNVPSFSLLNSWDLPFPLDGALRCDSPSRFPSRELPQTSVGLCPQSQSMIFRQQKFTSSLKCKLKWTPAPLPEMYIRSMRGD